MKRQQPKERNIIKQKIIDNIDEIFVVAGLLSISFAGFGLRNIDNYINWLEFPIVLLLAGGFFGLVIYFVLSFYVDNIDTYKNTNNTGILTMLVVFFSFTSFGIGAMLNEYSTKGEICETHIIYDMGESGRPSTRAYYIFINNGKKVERLSFGKKFNNSHKVGDRVEICIVTGWLGYKYYRINTST